MKKIGIIMITILMIAPVLSNDSKIENKKSYENIEYNSSNRGHFIVQWEKSYGKLPFWSARYEGPQPIGDADNDGKNELLIGGRDPFLRVIKWNGQSYYEHAKIIDPIFAGYSIFGIPEPFGSATGFAIGDIDNDGKNEIGVAWGHHFSAFKWNGHKYKLMGRYIIVGRKDWGTTLDCIIGDVDNDGKNEVIVTGGYDKNIPEVMALKWNGEKFIEEANWNYPGSYWVYFPWIADVDNDGKNELIVNTNETIILKWNGNGWNESIVAYYNESYPFACIAKDSNNDGIKEIHVTFYSPMLKIFEYENGSYVEKASFYWNGEDPTIEAIDIGDVDNDGLPEIAVGTNHIHILKWNGDEYKETYIINATHGMLAVTCIGDIDNDGKNEINAGNVGIDSLNEDYKSWIFKYID